MVKSIAAAVVVIAAGLGASAAQAGNVSWSIGIDVPVIGAVVSNLPGYAPIYAPVYAPVPVYVPDSDFYVREPDYIQGPPVYRGETPRVYYSHYPQYGQYRQYEQYVPYSHHAPYPRTRTYDGPHRVVYGRDHDERGGSRQWQRPDQHLEHGADAWRGRDDRSQRSQRGQRGEWQRD